MNRHGKAVSLGSASVLVADGTPEPEGRDLHGTLSLTP
jgi:hypothetical protein